MKILKKLIIAFLVLFLSGIFVIWFCDFQIKSHSEKYIFSDISKLPNEKVGLVLGTSKNLKGGYKNYYFENRIDAAEQLYKSGKIKYLIVSGDNSQKNYNEPEDMMNALIERGVPKENIFMDFAGLRTLDSVIRAKEIFGQSSYIVISQKFHNERAVYLARENGIEAYGFNAKGVKKMAGLKTNIREKFARVKVFFDFLLGVKPKFGGEKVVIP